MNKIVTQDKLNELTGMSIDYGKGGGYCPHYQSNKILDLPDYSKQVIKINT